MSGPLPPAPTDDTTLERREGVLAPSDGWAGVLSFITLVDDGAVAVAFSDSRREGIGLGATEGGALEPADEAAANNMLDALRLRPDKNPKPERVFDGVAGGWAADSSEGNATDGIAGASGLFDVMWGSDGGVPGADA